MEQVYRIRTGRAWLFSGTGNDMGLRHEFHPGAKVAYHYFAA